MTKPLTWITKEGRVLRISEMGDDHLLAAISKVRRTHRSRCFAWARSAGRYSMTAPDGAADAAEHAEEEFLELSDSDQDNDIARVSSVYESLLREAHRRKLGVQLHFAGVDDGYAQ